eukprot:CAMPEP_0206323822 /NCGR_PEP_ID=MMETSP0106_2-20121207/20186_1 /ASSEMBLY_ACC=CAM_ASM_000206 /TAXON_ID=81532 /ORGANISM="Acanthoeca-like sp., Strain 10tr" /LENGTH=38 /DNA_ID= /DNA_START= /DNA_END= /DNA_ORIENTATION=
MGEAVDLPSKLRCEPLQQCCNLLHGDAAKRRCRNTRLT